MSSVAQALVEARALGVDRLDAQWLLAWVLGRDSSWLICHDDDQLNPDELQRYRTLVQRRAAGEPYAYLIGEREFHGLTLQVSPAVLVPRPDTEILVDWALELLSLGVPGSPQPEVIDLGTGSGAIALAVKHRHPAALVTALDTSPEALAVARGNAQRLGLSIELQQSDWWQAVAHRRFGLALSNPPYIAGQDEHLSALRFEPMLALSPGGDGLGAIRDLLAGAPEQLLPGAWMLIEHGWDQAPAVQALMRQAGFSDVATRSDLGGLARCTGGRWSPTA
jgi:release factor glutamine methyltransferase